MGNYVTSTSYSLMLPGFLKGNTTTADAEGTNFITHQVELAEGKVNASIANRYDITAFTSIPPLLSKLTEDIAIYTILKKTGYRADKRNEYMDDFKIAEDTLKSLNKGEMHLTYTDGSAVTALANSRLLSDTLDYQNIMNLDDETNWDLDQTRIDDIGATRN